MIRSLSSSTQLVLAVAGCTLLLAGCGGRDYDKLLADGLNRMHASAKFKGFYAASKIGETPVMVRVPLVFGKSYQAGSAHRDDGESIKPDRLEPPFLKLPGFQLCYEGFNDGPEGAFPFYCYLAALPARSGDADRLAADLQAKLKKVFPETPDAWQPVDTDTPEGGSMHWISLRVEGEQPFEIKQEGQVTTQNLPGTFELWLHDAEDYLVLIGWRAPEVAQGATNLPTDSADALRWAFDGPPKNVLMDMGKLPATTAGTVTIDRGASS